MEKKYYWLKLKKDFFKRHDIRIIEEMDNGKDYVLFYLKLLVESIGHDGELRFSDTIPYNEKMLATVTNTNIDIVRSAIKIFTELHMMDMCDNGTIYMKEVARLTGSETKWAEKKRIYRSKEDNVLLMSDKSKSLELEKELDIDFKAIDKRIYIEINCLIAEGIDKQEVMHRLSTKYTEHDINEAMSHIEWHKLQKDT